ncbi:ABC transporter family substrate-binding protein [Hoyosella subflava]|uniref:Extracellular solute-binding protein, family 5 n=1 Tax=Hoyosella subflava (strain DSM 45089 / JCM 17490 / NBRC 109087 / DQS3-9A1) TaxID=443218 RepID=F6EQT4_HOYSD|nr:ABC transporter family substrate-binding protein [Hoyosella subflava]AEF39545.1 Extracellular solute-binding protein, family 5 [Hoyosella subflava DQS3-9A1]
MTTRSSAASWLRGGGAVVVAAALALTGCSSSQTDSPGVTGAAASQSINPQDPSTLQDGGDLRIPVDALPTNYNPIQINGARLVTWQLAEAILPSVHLDGADGGHELNTAFFDSAELTADSPQTITYKINDDAVWSNGRPLTWEDLASQVSALSGSDEAFEGYSTVGYSDVAAVERGETDKEAILTFENTFAEWEGLFNLLLPLEVTGNAEEFNEGWMNGPTITSGPFQVDSIDDTAKAIVLERNPEWWAETPPLDRIILRALDSAARADELANGGIDLYPIGGNVDLYTRAQNMSGVEVRTAPERRAGQLTLNGSDDAILHDLELRQAIAQAIDPQGVTDVVLGTISPGAQAVGNHILPPTDPGYEDNSDVLPYDPEAAASALEELGWSLDGDFRAKDDERLSLRLIAQSAPVFDTVAGVIRNQLNEVGVHVDVVSVPSDQFYDGYLLPGAFDLAVFEWTKSASPFAHDRPVFQTPEGDDFGSNFGRVVVPGVEELYDEGLAELDTDRRNEIANEIDRLAWEYAHHIPLYAESGAYAVREGLANYGARGLAHYGFAKAGWVK